VRVQACEALGRNHQKHIRAYGEGNERRLTGKHETNSIDSFRPAPPATHDASTHTPSAVQAHLPQRPHVPKDQLHRLPLGLPAWQQQQRLEAKPRLAACGS
jgi:hypothetical protein